MVHASVDIHQYMGTDLAAGGPSFRIVVGAVAGRHGKRLVVNDEDSARLDNLNPLVNEDFRVILW